MAVVSNVVFGMQIPLSSYLQVCFSITNDVVMSISLMYEKAEAGEPFIPHSFCHSSVLDRSNDAEASQC